MSAGPVTLYGLKNCDSCKKALKELDASDRETAFVDIREDADLDRRKDSSIAVRPHGAPCQRLRSQARWAKAPRAC